LLSEQAVSQRVAARLTWITYPHKDKPRTSRKGDPLFTTTNTSASCNNSSGQTMKPIGALHQLAAGAGAAGISMGAPPPPLGGPCPPPGGPCGCLPPPPGFPCPLGPHWRMFAKLLICD
jgi:hypothetical protein